MRRALTLLAALGLMLGVPTSLFVVSMKTVEAQPQTMSVRRQTLYSSYDVTSTTYIYCNSASPPEGIRCSTGSADDDGWVIVNGAPAKAIQVEIDTINATSLDFRVEARLSGAENQAAQIYPGTGDDSRTATGSFIIQIPDAVYQIRLGLKVTGDSGTQDVDAVFNMFEERR